MAEIARNKPAAVGDIYLENSWICVTEAYGEYDAEKGIFLYTKGLLRNFRDCEVPLQLWQGTCLEKLGKR